MHRVSSNEININIYFVILFLTVPREDDYKSKSNINSRSDYATSKTKSDVVSIEEILFLHHFHCPISETKL